LKITGPGTNLIFPINEELDDWLTPI